MLSLSHQFLAFCRSKPADESFDARDGTACAGHQFLTANGYPVVLCGVSSWSDGRRFHFFPDPVATAIEWAFDAPRPVTWGALVDRLEEALVGRGM